MPPSATQATTANPDLPTLADDVRRGLAAPSARLIPADARALIQRLADLITEQCHEVRALRADVDALKQSASR